MKRLGLILGLMVVLCLSQLPAHAYSAGSCTNSQLVSVSTPATTTFPSCSFTLSCPAATSCTWTMKIQVSGTGYVTGRLYVPATTYQLTCTGVNACQAAQSGFGVPAGQSKTIECTAPPLVAGFIAYASVPAFNVSATCTATVG